MLFWLFWSWVSESSHCLVQSRSLNPHPNLLFCPFGYLARAYARDRKCHFYIQSILWQFIRNLTTMMLLLFLGNGVREQFETALWNRYVWNKIILIKKKIGENDLNVFQADDYMKLPCSVSAILLQFYGNRSDNKKCGNCKNQFFWILLRVNRNVCIILIAERKGKEV